MLLIDMFNTRRFGMNPAMQIRLDSRFDMGLKSLLNLSTPINSRQIPGNIHIIEHKYQESHVLGKAGTIMSLLFKGVYNRETPETA